MINEEQVEAALHFISEHSDVHARAKARVKGLEHRMKVVEATGFKEAVGAKSAEERKAHARTTPAFIALVDEHDSAWYEFQKLDTDMEYARLVFEAWRTEESTRRAAQFG